MIFPEIQVISMIITKVYLLIFEIPQNLIASGFKVNKCISITIFIKNRNTIIKLS